MRGDAVTYHIGWIAVRRSIHPCALARHVVGQFTLVEDRLATVPVPEHLLLLVVLNKQTGRRDIVAINHDPMISGVYCPPNPGAVVCAPRPDVIEDHVVVVYLETGRSAACGRSADAEEHVIQRHWIVRGARLGAVWLPNLEQHRRVGRTGIDDHSRHLYSIHVRNCNGGGSVLRHEGSETQSQHHCIRPLDFDGTVQRIDSGREDQVLSGG